jgi:hypothetical protein
MSNMHTHHLTDTEYCAVASSFNGYELERDNFLRWFEQAIVPHLHEHFVPGGRLRVLSVGAGPALFDLRLIAAIQRICGGLTLDWTLVEPNPAQFAQLEHNLRRSPVEGVRFHPILATWEQFQMDDRYDFLLFSHVMYELKDRAAALSRAALLLAAGGFGIVFNESSEGGQYLIRQEFLGATSGDVSHLISTEALQRIARGELALASRHRVLPMKLNVAPCLDPDDRSGNAFLALLLGCAIDRIEPAVLLRVRDLVRMISVPGERGERVMHQPGGLLLFAREDAALPTAGTAYPVPSPGLRARGA